MTDQPIPFAITPPQDLPAECCAKCHFVLTSGKPESLSYACRFSPPGLMFALKPLRNLANEVTLVWETASAHPPVQPQRWCGQFKPDGHGKIFNS